MTQINLIPIQKTFADDSAIEWVLPADWTRCYKSPNATPIWDPERQKITGYATQTPYQVIVSDGNVIRSWVPDDMPVSGQLLYNMALTFATLQEAEEAYADACNPEYADLFFA